MTRLPAGRRAAALVLAGAAAWTGTARAAGDRSGVSPQAVSWPAGPGSVQGLGEAFQPQPNAGSGTARLEIAVPKGSGGFRPELALSYDSGGGNGSLGLGWSLVGAPGIHRNTDRGVPLHVDGANGADDDLDGRVDNPEEIDHFTGVDGEELVPLADGSFRAENESAFLRYRRQGSGWLAQAPDGRKLCFGSSARSRVEDAGRVSQWRLDRQADANGNVIEYDYVDDPATPAQKYLRRVRWGQAGASFAVVLSYEAGRPDSASSFRSGFELRWSLRLAAIDVVSTGIPAPAFAVRDDFDGDGRADALIRRYRIEYAPGAHLSLLSRVVQLGADGRTSLPATTYSYSPFQPPANLAASLIRSKGGPSEALDSPSVELIDMNGDGLPDLLLTSGARHRVALNRGIGVDGKLAWAPSRPVAGAPSLDIASERVHLADATADGLADLLLMASNTVLLCFANTGEGSWLASPFPFRSTDTWPIWPGDGDGGRRSRSLDLDHNRANDVLHTSDTGLQLWMLLPDGRYAGERRLAPIRYDEQVFRFDLPGTHAADINGDRLQDLAWIQPGRLVWFPGHGRGDFGAGLVMPLDWTLTAAEIERSGFADVDADGLADLITFRPDAAPGGLACWLNRFDALQGPRWITGLPAAHSGDARRWADMNGNGTVDLVISQGSAVAGEKIVVIELLPAGRPHLLVGVDNGQGLRTRLEYESSIAQMVRADAAGAAWTDRMPIAINVVAAITEDDASGGSAERRFVYRDPYHDAAKQEFRGFRSLEVIHRGDAGMAALTTRTAFDTGRTMDCLKGKVVEEASFDPDGRLLHRRASTWGERSLASGLDGREVRFAACDARDEHVHEGHDDAVHVRTETDHDEHGNVVVERRRGVVDREGDEVVVERAFEIRLDDWRLNLPARETLRDGGGRRLREELWFHDARGNRERVEAWLDTEDRRVVVRRQSFDAYGNLVEVVDALGRRLTLAYDSAMHAAITAETVHLDEGSLETRHEQDLGSGVVTASVNPSGERTELDHDALGRLVASRRPGGAGESYEHIVEPSGSRIIRRAREDISGASLDACWYFDSRGRPLGCKSEGDGGDWRWLGARTYNVRGLVSRLWMPQGSETLDSTAPDPSRAHETSFHDALGRLVETLKADGVRERIDRLPLAELRADGNDLQGGGRPDVRRYDGLGRLVEVEERNGAETYLTSYTWNARGDLESITDALGNVRRFRFDSLGRLVEVDDPDRGRLRFAYDDAGNLVRREDAMGRVVLQAFDAANRLVRRVHAAAGPGGADLVAVEFHHDAGAGILELGDGTSGAARNTRGRLAWVRDAAGEEHFSYDERGNVEWVLRRVRDAGGVLTAYRVERRHDLLDREVEVVFPDNDRLEYSYGRGGLVARVLAGQDAGGIVDRIERTHGARPWRWLLGNGVAAEVEHDLAGRVRRERWLGPGGIDIRHDVLVRDAAGRVAAVEDLRPASSVPSGSARRSTARFVHDELHRLTRVTYGDDAAGGRIDHTHDALGNLLSQTTPPSGQPGHLADPAVRLGIVAYHGGRARRQGRRPGDLPGPHAATSTASGRRLRYDESGNVIALDGARLEWDLEDRLVRFTGSGVTADYVHSHSGARVIKRVLRGGAVSETVYLDRACEVRDGEVVKYAFLDGQRAARIRGSLSPRLDRVQRVRLWAGWNLVAAAVETGAAAGVVFGADSTVYQAHEYTHAELDASAEVPAGRALWVHVPSSRVAYLRGRALESPEPRLSPPPWHAWHRLDPFRPALAAAGPLRMHLHDGAQGRWRRSEPGLPSFLSDAPGELPPAQAFWADSPVTFLAGTEAPAAVAYYHRDVFGSLAAVTDESGSILEERTYHPFGAIRYTSCPDGCDGAVGDDFTGGERDRESGLVALEDGVYLDALGVFLGTGTRPEAAARALANPQAMNPYSRALRSPFSRPEAADAGATGE